MLPDAFLVDPEKNYQKYRQHLLRQYYLGYDVMDALSGLKYVYTLAKNFDYFAAIYGSRRVYMEIFSILGTIPEEDRLTFLAEAYRTDRTVLPELYDALLKFRLRLVTEKAPKVLVDEVHEVLNTLPGKPETVYLAIRRLIADYELWRQVGEEMEQYIPAEEQKGGPATPRTVTDAELAKLVTFIVNQIRNGYTVSTADIYAYFQDRQFANSLKTTALNRGLIVYDARLRSYIPTQEGLRFIGEETSIDSLRRLIKGGS